MTAMQMWTKATEELSWGKQRTLFDTLTLVSEGKVKVIYGNDSFQGSPCLINAVGCMVKDASQSPSQNERVLVRAFDIVCRSEFERSGVIEEAPYLSPLGAEILIRNFAPLKPVPALGVAETAKYKEPKDSEIQADLDKMMDTPAPDACRSGDTDCTSDCGWCKGTGVESRPSTKSE